MDFHNPALRVFELDEGVRAVPYRDSKGFWTVGIGHLIGESLQDLKLSQKIIEQMFQEDLAIAIREAHLVVGVSFFSRMTSARQIALVSMLFTLGRNKFLKFEKTIDAMKREDWAAVAVEILRSKWAADVDPLRRDDAGRDDRIAYMFRTGEYHPDYKIGETA